MMIEEAEVDEEVGADGAEVGTAADEGADDWLNGIGEWIGGRPESEFALAAIAEAGLSTDVIKIMTEHGLTPREVYSLVIPERTLKHRKSRKERLSTNESDRAIRTARILAQGRAVFGDAPKALEWMRAGKRRFGNRTPFELLETEAGGRLVEEMLVQIDFGMFA